MTRWEQRRIVRYGLVFWALGVIAGLFAGLIIAGGMHG